MASVVLVRYGAIPEVSRFEANGAGPLERGERVIVETHRGLQMGTVLNEVRPVPAADRADRANTTTDAESSLPSIVRRATAEDVTTDEKLRQDARAEFGTWRQRIIDWELELELIDLEWTADRRKLILYVLNNRGPDCTKLALRAAAAGLGTIEVQPVTAEGLVTIPSGSGGCGTCGCH